MSTIVFVDDDRSIREMLSVFFHVWGISLKALPTARDVIAYLEANLGTRLLITDIVMPDMDGVELARYVRSHYPKIEIIALTGTERVIETEKGVFREVLRKPFNVDRLRELAMQFCEKPPAGDCA